MSTDPALSLVRIRSLVDSFRARLPEFRGPSTTEAQIRLEFLDPYWEALGWDVRNRAGKSEAEKDVVIEAHVGTIEAGRTRSRRSDYLFRIDGFPRFFVEAKKPAIDLSIDKDAIFQAKTYAWNAKIPFAIVTDFEEFRLFDSTLKPYYNEPERGRITDFDLRFEDYITQWDVLCAMFGRDAVAGRSLEGLLAKIKKVRAGRRIRGFDRMLFDLRGTEPVDREFLAHLEAYRLRFARDLYQQNRKDFADADTRHGAARLTEAVGRLIDRLVFMRVCEDREIVKYGALRETVQEARDNRVDLYPLVTQQFREFDRAYNGYLFKAHFSEQLRVSGPLLADFLRSLYPPDEAYRFDVIADDLLGIVYERFLGSVISVRQGNVLQEAKPEVRHAGGVYYTPRFVVDTIIRRVVGPKIKGKAPLECLDVKILDPACGSGSFLIAAFEYLIRHCIETVAANPKLGEAPAKRRARKKTRQIAFQDKQEKWHLTPDFKADLLTSCLYGVDIDPQAVEVTIMSLYIKALEGEIPRDMLDLRVLPDLDNNIRCGNSLISQSDFDNYWDEKHGSLFGGDEDVRYRINAFDWTSQTRGFGRLLEQREGFDCLIGNPPYIRVQELNKWAPEECGFYKWKYASAAKGNYDIYVTFLERGLELLAADGVLGFICPHKFWQASYGQGIRRIIAQGRHLRSLIDFTDQQVFRGATTYTAIHVLSNKRNRGRVDYARVDELTDGEAQCEAIDSRKTVENVLRFKAAYPANDIQWFFHDTGSKALLAQVEAVGVPLFPAVCDSIFQGIITGADPIFLTQSFHEHPSDSGLLLFQSKAFGSHVPVEKQLIVPVVRRQGFEPFVANAHFGLLLPYDRECGRLYDQDTMQLRFPRAWDYLSHFKEGLTAREDGRFENTWWRLSRAQNISKWCGQKILLPYMINQLQSAWDEVGCFFVNVTTGGYGVELKASSDPEWPFYMTGLLNSRLLDFYLRATSSHFHSGYFPANKQFVESLPIKLPETASERKFAKGIAQRVRRIIEVRKRLQTPALSTHEREQLGRQVEEDEARIDELVLELYGVEALPN